MSDDIDGLSVDPVGARRESYRYGDTARVRRSPARLLGCERGVAAVEFGLAAPILLGALVPVADLGIAFAKQQQLRQAVQAGAQYAASHPWDQNSPADIAGAVTAATPLSGTTVSPAPYQLCGYPDGSAITRRLRQPLRKL